MMSDKELAEFKSSRTAGDYFETRKKRKKPGIVGNAAARLRALFRKKSKNASSDEASSVGQQSESTF